MKEIRNKLGYVLKFGACIAFGIAFGNAAKLYAKEPAKTDLKRFHVTGNVGRNEDGSLTIYLRNVSPDESDYLIALGDVSYRSLHEENKSKIIAAEVQSVSGEPYLAKVRPSAPLSKLVIHIQVLPLKFSLPKEHQKLHIDYIDLNIKLCKTPISTKTVVLEELTVRLPVSENQKKQQ